MLQIITNSVVIVSVVTLFITAIWAAFAYVKLRNHLKKIAASDFYKLGLDTITELFGPSYGTNEAQEFIFKKLYLKHPDPLVVALGNKVFNLIIIVIGCFIVITLGLLTNAIYGS